MRKDLDPQKPDKPNDWEGNNAAFTCPLCHKVFIVSGIIHRGGRDCPECQGSHGRVVGGKRKGGSAYIEWSDSAEAINPLL